MDEYLYKRINEKIDEGLLNDISLLQLSDDEFKIELKKIKDFNAPTANRNHYLYCDHSKFINSEYTLSELSHSWTLLKWAIYYSKYNKVKILLELGVDLHFKRDNNDKPAYYLMNYSIEIEMIDLCLQYGANLNYQDNYGRTLLHNDNISFNFYKELINKGANINIKDKDNLLPIHFCITASFLKENILKFNYLLKLKIEINKDELKNYIKNKPFLSLIIKDKFINILNNINNGN